MRQFCICLAALLCAVSTAAGEYVVTRIIDGDTIKVVDAYGLGQTVRLVGVDAPESEPNDKAHLTAREWRVPVAQVIASGREAAAFLRRLIPRGSRVTVAPAGRGVDDYDRTLAYVYAPSGQCVNDALVREGYARVFRREDFSRRGDFNALERIARFEGRGFWKTIWRDTK